MKRAEDLNWTSLFHQVCEGKSDLLTWSLPEPWVQTELYSLLQQQQVETDWAPINHEVPYITYLPVKKPQKRHLPTQGAVKWGDIALVSKSQKTWCWMELKVRRAGLGSRSAISDKDALTAIKQDVVAMIGMDIEGTADAWISPDKNTASYWFKDVLAPKADTLNTYSHHYVMAYLHLFGAVDEERFSVEAIVQKVRAWVARKNKAAEKSIEMPNLDINIDQLKIDGQHSLVIVQWSRQP